MFFALGIGGGAQRNRRFSGWSEAKAGAPESPTPKEQKACLLVFWGNARLFFSEHIGFGNFYYWLHKPWTQVFVGFFEHLADWNILRAVFFAFSATDAGCGKGGGFSERGGLEIILSAGSFGFGIH